MPREYQVISTDDHIIEPPGLFDGRLPKEFADRTPEMKESDEGAAWHIPGVDHPIEMSGLGTAAGQKEEEFSPKSKTFDAMRAGCYDPRERLKDMDLDGVDVQVTFPTLPGLAGLTFLEIEDKPYALALIRAFNDWLVDSWGAADPERLLGAAILPLWDPQEAATELRRAGARPVGARRPAAPGARRDRPALRSAGLSRVRARRPRRRGAGPRRPVDRRPRRLRFRLLVLARGRAPPRGRPVALRAARIRRRDLRDDAADG